MLSSDRESYERERKDTNAITEAPRPRRSKWGCQKRVRLGSFPTTNSVTCGYERATSCSHSTNWSIARGELVIARALPMWIPKERCTPCAVAQGIERSRNGFSLISSGFSGSQLTVILLALRPAWRSSETNHSPPSSSYLRSEEHTSELQSPCE